MRTGEDNLDMFLRFLLAPLIHFRGMVGHPGFMWVKDDGQPEDMQLAYLTSITHEKNPTLREQKLQEYAKQVQDEFDSYVASHKSQKQRGRESKVQTPEVIHLPALPSD
jgi:hypothetical protein